MYSGLGIWVSQRRVKTDAWPHATDQLQLHCQSLLTRTLPILWCLEEPIRADKCPGSKPLKEETTWVATLEKESTEEHDQCIWGCLTKDPVRAILSLHQTKLGNSDRSRFHLNIKKNFQNQSCIQKMNWVVYVTQVVFKYRSVIIQQGIVIKVTLCTLVES